MPPPATIPKYFTILMTEMRDAIIFVGFWRYSMPPPPSPDTTIFNYLNEREREGRHDPLKDFGAHQGPPPPDATIYLTNITDREGGGGADITFCRILAGCITIPPYYVKLIYHNV